MTAVSNTFSDVAPKLVARALKKLRPRLIPTQIANKDYSTGNVTYGETINVPVPWTSTPSALTPSNVLPAPTNRTIATVPVTVDKWYHDTFGMTSKEMTQLNKDKEFVPMGLDAVVDGLATTINQSLWALYYRYYNWVGNPGANPYASDYKYASAAGRILSTNKAPKGRRVHMISFTAEENARNLSTFAAISSSGDQRVIAEGEIGRKLGFDWYADDDVPLHTIGSITGSPVAAATAIGLKSVVVATGAGEAIALKQGDIVTLGTSTPYSVQADLTVGASDSGTLTIEPGLRVAMAGTEVLALATDFDASCRQNLALHPSSLIFVSRTQLMTDVDRMAGAQMFALPDPVSGVTLRIELIREYKQTLWDIDALWGCAVHRPELGVRVVGEST